ncbi:uncharacterized protein TM35_000302020 [Trypanosoma theileri]|uniref:Uncharacterized protein n=1 Tax=Trypanosoma theileri TaxID=67003 RepID=A0A1X0NN61_9TRYP|nr:uncharacterized protein TM35_000302020 [Trypanosoma theileri]ORC86162.1 hypothetical protein TM35_000302020 [Trypanosoma theileri]
MSTLPVVTGRCFWGRRLTPNGPLLYSAVLSSGSAPLSLLGNSYYERRFGGKRETMGKNGALIQREEAIAPSRKLPPLSAGDIVVKMSSATPASLRGRRVVDVTGIQTSYFNASERNTHARRCMDDVVESMHLYDGHEVPELKRGVVPIGRITVLCAFPLSGSETSLLSSSSSSSAALSSSSLLVVQNATKTLLKRSNLVYRSEEEGVQLVRVIAENCRAAALKQLHFSPIIRGDSVVGVCLK